MLRHRIVSGFFLLVMPALAAVYLPSVVIWLVLVAISSLAQLEFYSMVNRAGITVFRILGLICGAAIISATFCAIGSEHVNLASAYKWELLSLVGSIMVVFIRQFPQKNNDKPLETISCTLLGILYVPFLFNFITRLGFAWDGAGSVFGVGMTGRMLVFYLIIVVKFSDIGAYFIGRFFGKHKLFPRISPAKTWEGLFGGIGAAILASYLFCFLTKFQLGKVSMTIFDAVVLGLLLALVGVVGDMFESLLKRASGTKDSSSVIPGMGGILDVLDSLLFGAPVLYVYARMLL
ncbi:phosphatidate cytidylyltransferase [Verrucomicrobiota bacterium]